MNRTFLIISLSLAAAFGVRPEPVAAQGQKLAFLVGVKKYSHPNLTQLRYSENDVAELGRLLEKGGYRVTLLTDSAGTKNPSMLPSKANIDRELAQTLGRSKSREDTVLIAFAGHGLQFEGQSEAFFCPQDAKPFAEQTATLISLSHVYTALDQSFAGIKVLLVDACRNDPKLGRGVNGDRSPRAPRGVAVMFSCAAGEVAYEDAKYQHGVFFHFVLEGLRGKAKNNQGKVTFASLADYVSAEVSQTVPKVIGQGAQQSPNIKADLSGASPVLLTANLAARRQARLGIAVEAVKGIDAARWGLTPNGQPQVLLVVPNGGADALGLRRGDVILRVNDQDTPSTPRLLAVLKQIGLGERIDVQIVRDGQRLHLTGVYATDFDETEELRRLTDIADHDPAIQHVIAGMFANGRGATKNEGEAVQWYRKAAEQGFAPSQTSLACTYEHGRGIAQDYSAALTWYRKAAAQGHARAQDNLGWMYRVGRGMTRNDHEAVEWFKKAAEQGNVSGQTNLAWMYMHGWGVNRDYAESHRLLKKAIEQNYARAQNDLGVMYQNGWGVTRDDTEAVRLYQKAADQGWAIAQDNLGWMIRNGRGATKDYALATEWHRKAAAQGNASGMANLGYMYMNGLGVEKDDAQALEWHHKAAAQGNAQGQTNIGWHYANGRGVARDMAEAARWYRKGADGGDRTAMNNLGELYEDGSGVTKNYAEAVQWFKKAAEQGNATGQYNLGRMYEGGVGGLAPNQNEAIRWYRRAAEQGNTRAQQAMKRLGQV
jgi:TPR repeat protein